MTRFDAELAALRERVDAIDAQRLALLNARAAVVADLYTRAPYLHLCWNSS